MKMVDDLNIDQEIEKYAEHALKSSEKTVESPALASTNDVIKTEEPKYVSCFYKKFIIRATEKVPEVDADGFRIPQPDAAKWPAELKTKSDLDSDSDEEIVKDA